MVGSNAKDVKAYLRALKPPQRSALTQLRALILEAVPLAMESMEHRMPTYEVGGRMLCAFASQKRYMSLYMDANLVAQHREALAGLDVGKSCIRFQRIEDLPLDTVRQILEETL